jgi:hypothetical protein
MVQIFRMVQGGGGAAPRGESAPGPGRRGPSPRGKNFKATKRPGRCLRLYKRRPRSPLNLVLSARVISHPCFTAKFDLRLSPIVRSSGNQTAEAYPIDLPFVMLGGSLNSHFSNSLILRLREAICILPVRIDELISPQQQRIPCPHARSVDSEQRNSVPVWFGIP